MPLTEAKSTIGTKGISIGGRTEDIMKRTWIAGLLLFALVLSGSGAGYASAAESQGTDSNILIAYFSRVGNTDFPDDIDAVTSASLLKDRDKLYGNTQYVAAM